jgi:4-carboxymuconolactone decarboxylase
MSREELAERGQQIRHQLQHRTHPPVGPAATNAVPGVSRLTTEVAFGAVWSRPGLSLQDRMVCTLSVLSVLQHLPQLRTYLNSALNIGMQPRPIQEIFIQCSIYAGFPTMINALNLGHDVFAARGIDVPDTPMPDDSLEELDAKGRALMQKLHGERSQQGYASPTNTTTAKLYPVAIQYGYGEVWHRPDLDHRSRMICALAAFTALNLTGQLEKFIQSALNMDLSRDEVIEIIIQTGPYSGFPKALNALALAEQVLSST